jgi:hypothetical protein
MQITARRERFRCILKGDETILPGIFGAISARIIELCDIPDFDFYAGPDKPP